MQPGQPWPINTRLNATGATGAAGPGPLMPILLMLILPILLMLDLLMLVLLMLVLLIWPAKPISTTPTGGASVTPGPGRPGTSAAK